MDADECPDNNLERIASSPWARRVDEWRTELMDGLRGWLGQLRNQYSTSAGEDSVLRSVITDAPHLATRVKTLRYRQLRLLERIEGLDRYLADATRPVDVDDLRAEVRDLINEAQALRAEESDLTYEAFYVDLGVGG